MNAARVDMDGGFYGIASAMAFAEGASSSGCLQMLGTAWEWTSSQFLPFDGFKIDMYHYMSVLQFGDHRVTKGGSCATCSSLIRNTYRQAYYPSRTDAFTGFRTCAR
jgi:iron(II)-dependent oxidoreductase